jgi:hypothetical protein
MISRTGLSLPGIVEKRLSERRVNSALISFMKSQQLPGRWTKRLEIGGKTSIQKARRNTAGEQPAWGLITDTPHLVKQMDWEVL